MNNRYNRPRYIPPQQHRITISTTFLPMLCSKLSVKDVTLPRRPSASPEAGCLGQHKKRNNTTRNSRPPSSSSSSSSSSQGDRSLSGKTPIHHHYSKLRKIFSGKNLLTSNDNVKLVSITKGTGRSRGRRVMAVSGGDVDIDRMDPPLPVMKKERRVEDGDNLWRRRCALKGLQLQHIEVATNLLQPITTV